MGIASASDKGFAVDIVLVVCVEYICLIFFPFKIFAKSIARFSPSGVKGGSILDSTDFSACLTKKILALLQEKRAMNMNAIDMDCKDFITLGLKLSYNNCS